MDKMYSIEITNNGLVAQPLEMQQKHGNLGVQIFVCNYKTAIQIIRENNGKSI